MQNVVFSMKEYGHIEIHLKELMEERGVTRNALARATNTRFEVINKFLIELICISKNCIMKLECTI